MSRLPTHGRCSACSKLSLLSNRRKSRCQPRCPSSPQWLNDGLIIPLTGCGSNMLCASASIFAELGSCAFACSTTSGLSWMRTRPGRSGNRCRRLRDCKPFPPPISTNRTVELVVSWPKRFSKSRASKNTGLPSRWILMCACESFSAQEFSARYSKGDLSVGTELVHAVGIMPTGSLHWFDWSQSGRLSDPFAVILCLLAGSAWCNGNQEFGILTSIEGYWRDLRCSGLDTR